MLSLRHGDIKRVEFYKWYECLSEEEQEVVSIMKTYQKFKINGGYDNYTSVECMKPNSEEDHSWTVIRIGIGFLTIKRLRKELSN